MTCKLFASTLGSVLVIAGVGFSQTTPPAKSDRVAQPTGARTIEAFRQQVADYAKPNENHNRLNQLAGNWTVKTQFWVTRDAKSVEGTGRVEAKMVFGGRYLQDQYSGSDLGAPIEGMCVIGFDNASKQYQVAWVGSDTTEIEAMTGTYDAASKTFNFTGRVFDPAGEVNRVRSVVRIVDDKSFVQTNYVSGPRAKEYKKLEVTYTRAQ